MSAEVISSSVLAISSIGPSSVEAVSTSLESGVSQALSSVSSGLAGGAFQNGFSLGELNRLPEHTFNLANINPGSRVPSSELVFNEKLFERIPNVKPIPYAPEAPVSFGELGEKTTLTMLPIDIDDYLETKRPVQISGFVFSLDRLQDWEFETDKPKGFGAIDEIKDAGLIAEQTDKEHQSDLLKTANLIREISLNPVLVEEEKKAWIAKFERVVLEKTIPVTDQEAHPQGNAENELSVKTIVEESSLAIGSGQMPPKKPTQNGDQTENEKRVDPEWDVFKVDKITGTALKVLKSRFKIAREIVGNAFKQLPGSPKKAAQVETVKLDLFVNQEKGHPNSDVTIPPIAYKAQVALDFAEENDSLGMQKALNKTISNNEPKESIFPVEYQGRISQSDLDKDAQRLASGGAKNLILRIKRGWKPVRKLPFRNPFELKRVQEKAVRSIS